VFGLFDVSTWTQVLEDAGLRVWTIRRPLPPEYLDSTYRDRMFLCRHRG